MRQLIIQKVSLIFFLTLLIIFVCIVTFANAKSQYVQPLVSGLQVAIPYDIANIFNKPVLLGPIAGIIASISLLGILFFGVITSPFGYFFGIPSNKYVMGQPFSEAILEDFNTRSSRSFNPANEENCTTNVDLYPDFINTIFYWVSEVRDSECHKLILCQAHRAMKKLPNRLLKGYQFFSKKLVEIPPEHKNAIQIGLKRQKNCEEVYDNCPESIFGIVVRSAIKLMPKWTRRKALNPHLHF